MRTDVESHHSSLGSPRVLCVDDDQYLADLLRYALSREGYCVQTVTTGNAALKAVESDVPSIAILDVNLPDISGFELCRLLRSKYSFPVIMLTARFVDEDVLAGFAGGADDYITKPFSMQVLIVRMQTILARFSASDGSSMRQKRMYRLGAGQFDSATNQITVDSAVYRLTATEAGILRLLLSHEGQVIGPETMIERLRGYDSDTSASVIKTHILNLRLKLTKALGSGEWIHTVPGVGYTFRQAEPIGSSPFLDAHHQSAEAFTSRSRPR